MRSLRLASLLLLTALLWPAAAMARPTTGQPGPTDEALIASIARASGAPPTIFRHAETGAVRFLAAAPGRPIAAPTALAAATPEAASRAFLADYGQLFGLSDEAHELTVAGHESLPQRSFTRFQQVHQGVPVLGGELIVQTDDQLAVVSAGGEVLPGLALSVLPRVDAVAAEQTALATVAKSYGVAPAELGATPQALWIYDPALLGGPGPRVARLVWRSEVRGHGETPIRELVLVDAQTGALALRFSQLAEGRQRVVCNDRNVVDADGNQKNNCPATRYVRVEGQAATGVADVDLAYDYAGDTYDYFFKNFGRDSLDGRGMRLVSLVKYCPSARSCPYANAFWDGQQMTYGEGFASADDVVAHELAHGLTEFTSHLFYYYQSGAINEALSDVFGELIDLGNGRGDDRAAVRWLIGEDLPETFGVIRNMKDPTTLPAGFAGPAFAPSPDKVTSLYYHTAPSDRGGVHINSGVNNKAAALLADGGSFNGQTIGAIGLAKVGAIYYTLQTALLTSASNYQDLYTNLPAACLALAAGGSYGVTAADCGQVQKAVEATEMDVVPEPTMTRPAACPAGQRPADVYYEDFERPAKGGWATRVFTGTDTWFYPATDNPFGVDFTYATSGSGNLWGYTPGGGPAPEPPNDVAIAMTSSVSVPPGAFMHFRHSYDFEADSGNTYDGGVLEYSTNGGQTWQDAGPLIGANGYNGVINNENSNPLGGRSAFVAASMGYGASRLDLSSLAGTAVRFRFRIASDLLIDGFGWFIDDLRIYTCRAGVPAAAWAGANRALSEGAGLVPIAVTLDAPSASTVSFTVAVSGTAVAGVDYQPPAAQLVIPAGGTVGAVSIRLLDNAVYTPGRTIVLTLTAPRNATVAGGARTLTIVDNDPPHRVRLPLVAR